MAKNMNMLGYVLIIFVIGVMLKIYFESDAFNLKCIVSDVDGNKYCVKESMIPLNSQGHLSAHGGLYSMLLL